MRGCCAHGGVWRVWMGTHFGIGVGLGGRQGVSGPNGSPPPPPMGTTPSQCLHFLVLTPLTFYIICVCQSFQTCTYSPTFYTCWYFDSFRTCRFYIMGLSVLIAPRGGAGAGRGCSYNIFVVILNNNNITITITTTITSTIHY